MNPTINGVKTRVFWIPPTAEIHEFRNRPADKEAAYEFLMELKTQPVWHSEAEIRAFERMDRLYSDGYFIFKNSTLKRLGINPAPTGANWNRYRFQPYINGEYSTRLLEVVGMKPESPLRGIYKLWYAYFNEIPQEGMMDIREKTLEQPPVSELTELVDVVRRYE